MFLLVLKESRMNGFQSFRETAELTTSGWCVQLYEVGDYNVFKWQQPLTPKAAAVVKNFPISVSKVWVKQSAVTASSFLEAMKWQTYLCECFTFCTGDPGLDSALMDMGNLSHDF